MYKLSASHEFQTTVKNKKLSYIELQWSQEEVDGFLV